MVDVIWAAAVLDVRAPVALSRLRELAALLELPQLDVSSQQRLFQAYMAFEKGTENGSGGQGVPLLPSEMLPLTKAAWQDRLMSISVSQVSTACTCLLAKLPVLTHSFTAMPAPLQCQRQSEFPCAEAQADPI